jgi:hypothetical protein
MCNQEYAEIPAFKSKKPDRPMKTVKCVGIVGSYDIPMGRVTMYDTGRKISPENFDRIKALQHTYFKTSGKEHKQIVQKIQDLTKEIIEAAGVYPVAGQGAFADDGRIFVTQPCFNTPEEEE